MCLNFKWLILLLIDFLLQITKLYLFNAFDSHDSLNKKKRTLIFRNLRTQILCNQWFSSYSGFHDFSSWCHGGHIGFFNNENIAITSSDIDLLHTWMTVSLSFRLGTQNERNTKMIRIIIIVCPLAVTLNEGQGQLKVKHLWPTQPSIDSPNFKSVSVTIRK